MAARPKRSQGESQLRVLQQAMASAIHEFAQPLNVMQLLAENAQDDLAELAAGSTGDPALVAGLTRRLRSMVDQSERASDIARHIRAFAVDVGAEKPAFDVNNALRRIASLLSTDLKSMGAELSVEPAEAGCAAAGDETLVMFALTEAVLRLSRGAAEPGAEKRSLRLSTTAGEGGRRPTATVEAQGLPAGGPASDAAWLAELPLLAGLAERSDVEVAFGRPGPGRLRIAIALAVSTF